MEVGHRGDSRATHAEPCWCCTCVVGLGLRVPATCAEGLLGNCRARRSVPAPTGFPLSLWMCLGTVVRAGDCMSWT